MKCPLLIDSSNFWLAGLTTEPVNRASQPLPAVQLPLQASPKFLSSSPKFRPIKFFCRRESWREKSSNTNLFAFIRKKPEKIQKKKKVAEFDSFMKKLVSGSRPRTRCLCNSESPALLLLPRKCIVRQFPPFPFESVTTIKSQSSVVGYH